MTKINYAVVPGVKFDGEYFKISDKILICLRDDQIVSMYIQDFKLEE